MALQLGSPPATPSSAGPAPGGAAPCDTRGGGGGGRSRAAMLGLLVHNAVDGLALGAVAHTGGGEGSMLVFMAIMLHKAPAAFGLATYLLQLGDPPRAVKQQMLVFSSAAPVRRGGAGKGGFATRATASADFPPTFSLSSSARSWPPL